MDANANLAQLNEDVERWLAHIADAQTQTPDAAIREQLQSAAQALQKGRDQFNDEYLKTLQDLQDRLEAAKQSAAETMKKAAAARAEAEAAAKKPPFDPFAPPPPLPPMDFDPAFGLQLRSELLHRFGKLKKAEADFEREIWEDLE